MLGKFQGAPRAGGYASTACDALVFIYFGSRKALLAERADRADRNRRAGMVLRASPKVHLKRSLVLRRPCRFVHVPCESQSHNAVLLSPVTFWRMANVALSCILVHSREIVFRSL